MILGCPDLSRGHLGERTPQTINMSMFLLPKMDEFAKRHHKHGDNIQVGIANF